MLIDFLGKLFPIFPRMVTERLINGVATTVAEGGGQKFRYV